jgi:hypothetical protein
METIKDVAHDIVAYHYFVFRDLVEFVVSKLFALPSVQEKDSVSPSQLESSTSPVE